MRKTRRNRGRNAELYAISITPSTEQPAEFHNGLKPTTEQRNKFCTLIYDNFPELLQPVASLHVSRQWDHPIDILVAR
jgi:hypothetical protein